MNPNSSMIAESSVGVTSGYMDEVDVLFCLILEVNIAVP